MLLSLGELDKLPRPKYYFKNGNAFGLGACVVPVSVLALHPHALLHYHLAAGLFVADLPKLFCEQSWSPRNHELLLQT